MYNENEKPEISASILYFDKEYGVDTARKISDILCKYGFDKPGKIYAGCLTNNRYKKYPGHFSDLFIRAYSEKDVMSYGMASGDSRKADEYWRFDCNMTFYKDSKLAPRNSENSFEPWNVINLSSTYGRLKDKAETDNFLKCVKDLILLLNPFYADIDDISNSVDLLFEAGEQTQVSDRIQQIYWGNYYGPSFCQKYGTDKMLNLPAYSIEKLGDGVFYTLCENVFGFASDECKKRRKQIRKILNLKPPKEKYGFGYGGALRSEEDKEIIKKIAREKRIRKIFKRKTPKIFE